MIKSIHFQPLFLSKFKKIGSDDAEMNKRSVFKEITHGSVGLAKRVALLMEDRFGLLWVELIPHIKSFTNLWQ